MRTHTLRLWVLGVITSAATGVNGQTSFSLDPRGTYLRTNSDSPNAPLIVDLAAIGITSGETIRLSVAGSYQQTGSPADQSNGTIAVFSSSSTLLATSQPHRVPGAIAAGVPVFTAPTFFGGLPTDIPEDFRVARANVTEVVVEVPAGAVFLFVCPEDTLYFDNSDPDGDYRVTIGSACLADFDHNGIVNSVDVGEFINAWFQDQVDGTLVSDWDGNGIVNSTDVGEFINSWFEDIAAGCG